MRIVSDLATTMFDRDFGDTATCIPFASTTKAHDSLCVQVNIPKTRRTYCKSKDCHKHTQHKVTQYKAGKVRIFSTDSARTSQR